MVCTNQQPITSSHSRPAALSTPDIRTHRNLGAAAGAPVNWLQYPIIFDISTHSMRSHTGIHTWRVQSPSWPLKTLTKRWSGVYVVWATVSRCRSRCRIHVTCRTGARVNVVHVGIGWHQPFTGLFSGIQNYCQTSNDVAYKQFEIVRVIHEILW